MGRPTRDLTWIVVRRALAIAVAGIALCGAAFLASADLTMHGHYHCDLQGAPTGECNLQGSYWVADRAAWQIPVAIVIAALRPRGRHLARAPQEIGSGPVTEPGSSRLLSVSARQPNCQTTSPSISCSISRVRRACSSRSRRWA